MKKEVQIKKALDNNLEGVFISEQFKQRMVKEIVGGEKMKKKTSFTLILVFALCLMATTAFAYATWQEYAKSIPAIEQESGHYQSWSFAEKQRLLETLVHNGFIDNNARVLKLLSEEPGDDAGSLIDQVISEWVGVPVEEVNFMDIMEAAWGPFDNWTHEQRAWYSEAEQNAGISLDDKTIYGMPSEQHIDESHAIDIAKAAFSEAFEMNIEMMDLYDVSCDFQEKTESGLLNQWYVLFTAAREENVPIHTINIFVDGKTGAVNTDLQMYVDALKDQNALEETDPLQVQFTSFMEDRSYAYRYFGALTIEDKALFSKEFRDKALQYIAEHSDYDNNWVIGITAFRYGLPTEQNISYQDALTIANQILRDEFHVPEELITYYLSKTCVYFDITDEELPLWKFYYDDSSIPIEIKDKYYADETTACYKVELNAETGDIIYTNKILEPLDFNCLDSWKDRL